MCVYVQECVFLYECVCLCTCTNVCVCELADCSSLSELNCSRTRKLVCSLGEEDNKASEEMVGLGSHRVGWGLEE